MRLIILLLSALSAQAAYVNWDVHNYSWDGKSKDVTCIEYNRTYERFTASAPPYPQHSQFVKYSASPLCQFNGLLVEDRVLWTSVAMADSNVYSYQNGVCIQTNAHTGPLPEYQPKRIREMAYYTDLNMDGSSGGKFSRYTFGRQRFWINAVTNGNYYVKVTFTGGYWDDWFPGHSYPGDIDDINTPAVKQFNYVADGVRINNITPNYAGVVYFYWNPYGGVTIDLTPTVANATRGRHWKYHLIMEIP